MLNLNERVLSQQTDPILRARSEKIVRIATVTTMPWSAIVLMNILIVGMNVFMPFANR